ncbi:DUF4136 domain-containing protein [Aquimarina sp. AD10]|uniref:DUF4136 domain-containing protein n=1 Tax=Aquimarina aggregata TaxID=1642818 RepID=A0A163CUJ5_9FLAO|nr:MULTISPECIES: DUF4136 domain-containing protein [Aquimarina]AXT62816.1 DUF4136 domain-containing protein [Aquimarina sp. AD10]KZS42771.1 hypothetical protein AWE51_15480 [Aquimarina aggregata]RKN02000.1 DUF4136 domain-containing protein [Aquimarina sp. AD10]
MKFFSLLSLILIITLSSCTTVRVASDYDKKANFNTYRSFAFYKPGIDKADISDLDKKRILRAIEADMATKGFSKSDNPDMLVSIFTKTKENINIYQNNFGWGYGWGWNPWFWGGNNFNSVSRVTEGTLYIDLIDASKKELVWQGMGTSALTKDVNRKQEKMNEIVTAILKEYPPLANN